MNDERHSRLVIGIGVLAFGLVLLAQQLAPSRHLEIGRLWPVVLIVIGANKVIEGWHNAGRMVGGGLSLILVGAVLLLHTQDILSIRQTWPLFVVSYGLGMVFGSGCGAGARKEQVSDGR